MSAEQAKEMSHIRSVLENVGFDGVYKMADTLQGGIYRGYQLSKDSMKTMVIKRTNEYLHRQSVGIVNNKRYKVQENVLMEKTILEYLTRDQQCPDSIIKFYGFLETSTDYYLFMEDGGSMLYNFIQASHKFIKAGQIKISHWKQVVKTIMNQMIEAVEYIHSKNVCHFDISLENMLINDVEIEVSSKGKQEENVQIMLDDMKLKLCDFGLAKAFTDDGCKSNDYVGKTMYRSPEVARKSGIFDSKKNDIWCLGVCCFMMVFGIPPWKVALPSDKTYLLMTRGFMKQLLNHWGYGEYVDDELIDLLQGILQKESKRFTLSQIKNHQWMKM